MGGTIWLKMPIFKEANRVWLAILYKHFQRCARDLYHLIEKLRGDDLAQIADFQTRKLSLVSFYINIFSAARVAFIISSKIGGTMWRILAIFEDENWIWLPILYKHFQRCACGLHHFIDNWGDELAHIADFQKRNLNLVAHLLQAFSALRARPWLYHNLNENDNFKRATNECLLTCELRQF